MKKYFKSAITLFAICAFFALLLALVHSFTQSRIEANSKGELLSSLNDVIVANSSYSLDDEVTVENDSVVKSYFVVRSSNSDISCVVLSLTGNGFGGEFSVIASYDTDGDLLKVKLLDNSETSGLGKKYEDQSNLVMFSTHNTIPQSKSELIESESAIVSGATVTFDGIVKAVTAGQEFAKKLLQEVR